MVEIEAEWTDFRSRRTESAHTSIRVNIPEDQPKGNPVDYDLKLDLSGPEPSQTNRPRQKPRSGQSDANQQRAGSDQQRSRRQGKPRRPIPKALEERVEEMVRERTRAEVQRQLRELGHDQPREPRQGPPDVGGEEQWPEGGEPGQEIELSVALRNQFWREGVHG